MLTLRPAFPDRDVTRLMQRISQDEPIEGRGDGNTDPDGGGLGTDVATLRSERSGLGDGRFYHVSFEAFDEQGASCEGTVSVCVPHDQGAGGGCVDQGPLFDSVTGLPLPQVIGPENGGFETGDLTGWGQINSGSGGISIDDGSFDPPGPGGPVAPFAGGFSAATFQGGPGVHTLFQDVTLGAGLLSAKLLWADHLENHAGVFADPAQEWRVEVWDPADDSVLGELFSTNPGDPAMQGWTERMGDLSPWIGQTIRIAFTQQDGLFFFNARLDEVSILGELAAAQAGGGEAADSDADGVDDAVDNCVGVANPGQEVNAQGAMQAVKPDGIACACLCGDVNRDCVIDSRDALEIKRAAGFAPPALLFDVGYCDVNGDATCNSSDALEIILWSGFAPAATAIHFETPDRCPMR